MTAVIPIATCNDLVAFTLRASGIFGIGQTPLPQDYADGITLLNGMIGTWNAEGWFNFYEADNAFTSTGAQTYTVGPGGNFNIPQRPSKLLSAFVRQQVLSPNNPVDYQLSILNSREDYNRIALKTLGSWPTFIYYDQNWPTALVYPWPIPQAAMFELHLTFDSQLGPFTNTVQAINLPPEYFELCWTNLAARLAAIYQFELSPTIVALALKSLATVRQNNAQIPRLKLPSTLRQQNRRWNIYSGDWVGVE